MSFIKIFFLFIAAAIFLFTDNFAQLADLKLEQLGIENGLSQSTVYSIVQDSQGFMWFGTQDGLNRYDGYSIKVFKHTSDINSIADNTIWNLLSDHKGNLWIATLRGGLDRCVPSENKFYHYTHNDNDPSSISEVDVRSIFEDSYGQIWVGTRSKGINKFNAKTGTFTRISFDEGIDKGIDNTIWSMCEDKNRNLWIASTQGLYQLTHGEKGSYKIKRYKYAPSDDASLSTSNIRTLFVDKKGTLWIGTWGGGLNRMDITKDGVTIFKHYLYNSKELHSVTSNAILAIYEDSRANLWIATYDMGLMIFNRQKGTFTQCSNDALSLYEDRSGILWIGTIARGVDIYDKRKISFRHYFDNPEDKKDMNGNDVFAILKDKDGELWVGTDGDGLNRFTSSANVNDLRKNVITYNVNPQNLNSISSNKIYALCQSANGKIWIGTKGGGLNLFDKSSGRFTRFKHNSNKPGSISSDEIMSLCEDKKGRLWIGNNEGGIDLLMPSGKEFIPTGNGLSGKSVMSIYEDKKGNIWVGSFSGGLHKYNPDKNSFEQISYSNKTSNATDNTVFTICEDMNGIIWFGTFGSGLYGYNPVQGTFISFKEEDGLPNNVVYGILPDSHGNLWLSTNKGVSRFNINKRTFRNFDVKDGLQSNEFNQGAYFAGKDKELFFGGINGFNTFFPDEIKDNNFIPPVYITTFKIVDELLPVPNPVPSAKQIELSYAENFISFEFVALNYTAPEKNKYAYFLEGFDKDWHTVSAQQRFASYTNLDPDKYILHVKASNNDGIWNQAGTTMIIVITPPFWSTWWFRVLIVLSVAGILFLIYQYRVTKLLEIERIRSSIAVDLHDDIGSTLTEIALYSDLSLRELRSEATEHAKLEKQHKIESLLENIGVTSRRLIDAMNDIVWAVDPKNDSFEFLLLRMKSQAARMFDAKMINYEIDIPEELSSLRLPLVFRRHLYLIFKEAVNNIIRHAHPTKAIVKVRKSGSYLIMTITDDGKGFDTSVVYDGNGLHNMHKRAEALNGKLSLESVKNKETQIKLVVSLP